MKKLLSALFLAVFLFALAGCGIVATDMTSTLSGTVMDQDGNAKEAVRMVFESDDLYLVLFTGFDGTYSTELTGTKFDVLAELDGCEGYDDSVRLKTEVQTMDLELSCS